MRFYNVYIESGVNKHYIIALDDQQIDKLVKAYLAGIDKIKIKGVDRYLTNARAFVIYSITNPLVLSVNQEETERKLIQFKKYEGQAKMNLRLYKKWGANITDSLTTGQDWGALKSKPIESTADMPIDTSNGKIFISHSVGDKVLVQKFTEDILQIGLGIKPEEIFNMSIEDAGIKNGEDFKKRIEKELITAKIVIQIITENYKESEACLNEMGAAWILKMPVVPFILNPISYNTVGFIHNANQQLKINSKKDLLSFISQSKVIIKANYDDSKLHRKIDEFLGFIQKKIGKKSQSVVKTKTKKIGDWIASTKQNIQGADYKEVDFKNKSLQSISCKIFLYSDYLRFGFKLLSKDASIFGKGWIPSNDDSLLVHIGKEIGDNKLGAALYVKEAFNASEPNAGIYEKGKVIQIRLEINSLNQLIFRVNGKLIFEKDIENKLRKRICIMAWGDTNEYKLLVKGIQVFAR